MAVNYAQKYDKKVDERFYKESQALMGCSNAYEFTGVRTVNVYSIPTADMVDYSRNGANRYGIPDELQNNIQAMEVRKDRAFTFTIDKGNKIQTQMVMDAGKALSRQLREKVVPEFDSYVFGEMADAAVTNGATSTDTIDKTTAYEAFLAGQEWLGDRMVPDAGRIAFCSYRFANMLKQDSAFMRYGNMSQEMILKGVLGEVDGTKIIKVPSSRLPGDASFILVHPSACVAPKQLEDYKIHDNPPGISGWLVEGRIIYDAFVLSQKVDALYYAAGSGVLGTLIVSSVEGSTSGKSIISVAGANVPGTTLVYKTGTSETNVTYGMDVSSGWTVLPEGGEITPTSSHTIVQVVAKDASNKAKSVGKATLSIKA